MRGKRVLGAYGTNKIAAENALLKRVSDAYILRPPYLYGEYNNVYREAFVFDCAERNAPFYLPKDGSMPLQFFHVEDLCRFIETLIALKPQQRIYNVGNAPVTVKKWVEACYAAVGKKPEFISITDGTEQRNYFPFYEYGYVLDTKPQNEIMPDLLPLKIGLQRAHGWYKVNKSAAKPKNYFDYIEKNFKYRCKMIGVYFSGTGNTKHCVERFLNGIESGVEMFALENPQAVGAVRGADEIVFAYPVYYSNLPKIVRDFIIDNAELWRGKRIFIIATMGAFSGDGTGCAARLFKKFGARVTGGLHLKMPDCIGDVKLLKKPLDKNRELIKKADEKIDKAVANIKRGKYTRNGLGIFAHIAGLFGQRLYFSSKTKKYFAGVKSDGEKCVGCGICAGICPMQNIKIEDGRAKFSGKCTMCYRCFSNCPKQAITLIGKRVYEQSLYEKYVDGCNKCR